MKSILLLFAYLSLLTGSFVTVEAFFVQTNLQVCLQKNNVVLANSKHHYSHHDEKDGSEWEDVIMQAQGKVMYTSSSSSTRRGILQKIAASALTPLALLSTPLILPIPQQASATATQPSSPPITHKVNFNVRISRADGTFYVRDDPPETIPTPDNQVFTGTITIGLYGTLAPNHVAKFLQYVDDNNNNNSASKSSSSGTKSSNVYYYNDPFDEPFPLPFYSKSIFPSFDQSNGLLTGGTIPGLFVTTLSGSSALEYRGKILPASLWIDDFTYPKFKISHNRKGLVTHRNFEVLPTFGITTRESLELDSSYTVFGEVLMTDQSNAFFDRILDLPTYSNTRIAGGGGSSSTSTMTVLPSNDEKAVDEIKSSIYSFQKDLFRSAAKTFGDSRLDNIYEGKILRRVEVTFVSVE